MTQKLVVRLLGGLELKGPGLFELPNRKGALLAAYLAFYRGRMIPREQIRNLLWSDRRDEQAAGSLRRALADLRKSLVEQNLSSVLDAGTGTLSLLIDRTDTDSSRFEQLIGDKNQTSLIEAANLYQGNLLEGIPIPDPAFEDWLMIERQRLKIHATELVERLSKTTNADHAHESVVGLANRLLSREQTCEEAHRALMRCHIKTGRSTAAAKQYDVCRSALHEALGITPEKSTQDLWAQVIADEKQQALANIRAPQAIENSPDIALTSTPVLNDIDKPSIAVLPFKNLSGDPSQDYFVDGIVEDIINGLSKYRSLLVIARHSSFEFSEPRATTADIVSSLGARYLVEGSVRRSEGAFRISVGLIDGMRNTQTWSQRYDRNIEDIFEVQDEVTDAIVAAIEPELLTAERERIRRKQPQNLTAWEMTQHGLWHLWQQSEGSHIKALEILEKAIELDGHFAASHAGRAYAICHAVKEGVITEGEEALTDALAAARTAVRLDPNDAFSYVSLGRTQLARQSYDAAVEAYEVAIDINPNLAYGHFGKGYSLCLAGDAGEALPSLDRALMLSPRDPQAWSMATLKSFALTILEQFEEALMWARKAQLMPNAPHWALVAEVAPLAYLGKTEEAERVLAAAVKLKPELDVAFANRAFPFKGEAGMKLLAQAMLTTFVPRQDKANSDTGNS